MRDPPSTTVRNVDSRYLIAQITSCFVSFRLKSFFLIPVRRNIDGQFSKKNDECGKKNLLVSFLTRRRD